jgi:HK97 family phage portal protein
METYVKAYQENADVYAIISRTAEKLSSIPFSVKKIENRNKFQQFNIERKNNIRRGAFGMMDQKMIGAEAFESGSLPLPLERPNPYQTWAEFFSLSEIFLLTTGNLYWTVERPEMGPNAGKPTQIYVLPSHFIQIIIKDGVSLRNMATDTDQSVVAEYWFRIGSRFTTFSAADTYHMNFPGVEYDMQGAHLYGQSPLRAVLREIQASDEGSKNDIKMMKSGGAIGIIHGENDPLDEDQAKQLKNRLIEIKNDSGVMGQIAGISQKIGFTRIALPTKDLQPMEYDLHFQKKIANAIGFPTRLLNNDAAATYDNMALAYRELIINRIMPDLNMMTETLNTEILPDFGPQYKRAVWQWDFEKLAEMQEDIETLVKWGSDMVDRGVLTRAEMRRLINFEPTGDADMEIPTTGTNVIPLSEAVRYNLDGEI